MQDNIEKIEVHYVKIPLKEAFVISRNSREFYEGVIIELITKSGVRGFGEAVPSKYVMNETVGGAMSFAKNELEQIKGKNIFSRNEIMDLLKDMESPHCIMNAVDSALIDIAGKILKVPAYKIFGADKKDIKTSATVSIGNIYDTVKSAEMWLKYGFKALKMKIGLNLEEDIRRIKDVRSISDDFDLYVDANQGYSVDDAIRFAEETDQYDVEFIEQPVSAENLSALRKVKLYSPVPIMADESVKTPEDAINIILMDAVDYINIKLTKAGGIDEALKIAHIAEAAHKGTMVGCMLGTPLLLAASYTVFNTANSIMFADLDGFLTFKDNPVEGGAYLENGFLKIYDGNGLAVKGINL